MKRKRSKKVYHTYRATIIITVVDDSDNPTSGKLLEFTIHYCDRASAQKGLDGLVKAFEDLSLIYPVGKDVVEGYTEHVVEHL